jgi:hypothetical protein
VILIPRGIIVELQHYFRKRRPKPLERSLT